MTAVLKQQRFIFTALILLLAGISGASALNQHLNVTFRETVHQNVTFAANFDLVENRTYSLIEGIVNITNPGTETVFDINLKVTNTDYLSSNFLHRAGRNGTQIIYPKNNDNATNVSVITTTYTSMGKDIDEDGIIDTYRVTSNSVQFNVSGEYQILSYTLYNASGQVANLGAANQVFNNVLINVTSVTVDGDYNEGVVYATLRINGTQSTINQLNGTQLQNLTLNDTQRRYVVLHIPEIRASQSVEFAYNISSVYVEPPLDINTTYTNSEFQTKVLAGEYFGVRDTATNVAPVGALTILNITIEALSVNVSNGTTSQLFNFTLHNLSATGDYANVYGNGTNNRTWYWVTNAGNIPIGQTFNISYLVRAPDTVSSSGTFAAIRQNLTYRIDATASNVSLAGVRARAEINFSTTKQIISPQDNLSNNNVTWRSVPSVGSYQNITFTLEKVSLWVTSTLDPNQIANSLNTTYTINSPINMSTSWVGSSWLFNFTDGSSDSNPPPIVWIKPYWIIQNAGGQVVNQSITINGTDIYIKYIYVVNGYWLEVFKNVTSAGESSYNIKVHVHNRGNGHTPQNLTVTVYDFIPTEFTAYGFSPSFNNASNVSGQFTGTAYQWDVGLRTNLSTSFAPNGDPSNLDEYYLNYSVNGSGDFRVTDLYIIGLDPRKIENAGAHEGIAVLSGIASTSKELVYLGIVVFLIAVNVGNFLMTSRINKKLDKKE